LDVDRVLEARLLVVAGELAAGGGVKRGGDVGESHAEGLRLLAVDAPLDLGVRVLNRDVDVLEAGNAGQGFLDAAGGVGELLEFLAVAVDAEAEVLAADDVGDDILRVRGDAGAGDAGKLTLEALDDIGGRSLPVFLEAHVGGAFVGRSAATAASSTTAAATH